MAGKLAAVIVVAQLQGEFKKNPRETRNLSVDSQVDDLPAEQVLEKDHRLRDLHHVCRTCLLEQLLETTRTMDWRRFGLGKWRQVIFQFNPYFILWEKHDDGCRTYALFNGLFLLTCGDIPLPRKWLVAFSHIWFIFARSLEDNEPPQEWKTMKHISRYPVAICLFLTFF